MTKLKEDELLKKCPTCGSEITGISEVFSSHGKKLSKSYSYEDSYDNEKEHKFALKEEENNNKETHMILSALEFFTDYKFNSGDWTSKEYAKRIEDIPQNDYAKVCKRMGGKARFEPEIE